MSLLPNQTPKAQPRKGGVRASSKSDDWEAVDDQNETKRTNQGGGGGGGGDAGAAEDDNEVPSQLFYKF